MDVRETGVGRSSLSSTTGTHINYYFVCKRKLWLFAHGISMEHTSDTVLLGKLIDESSYTREDKSIAIDDTIVLDWIDDRNGVLHEVKKSDRMEEAHVHQVQYYLWYLKQKGIAVSDGTGEGLRGELDYPKLKQRVPVVLTPEAEGELNTVLTEIGQVIEQPQPPDRITKRFCKTCSYFELCWG